MKIELSESGCKSHELSLGETLLLLAIYKDCDIQRALSHLDNLLCIYPIKDNISNNNVWKINEKGIETLNSIVLDSDKELNITFKIVEIAQELKNIFPKGKKPGTNYYWAEGLPLVIKRLRMFFKKYGIEYTKDQIINAAKKYVEGFNGDYTYMKLLKYFIMKNEKQGDLISEDSQLLSYIENADQEDDNDNWTTELK